MPRGRPKNTAAPKKTTGTIKRRLSPATIQRAEHHAYDRAADLAKSYAEHWEAEAMHEPTKGGGRLRRGETSRDWDATIKAGHWRIIEKEIRALALTPGEQPPNRKA